MRIEPPSATLLWMTPDPLEVIEAAGRICYRSEGKAGPGTAGPFVRRLIARGHESVLEHAVAMFRIVTDRGVSHEIVRHRLASYAQESTRYCNYAQDRFGREIAVVEPPGLSPEARAAWVRGVEAAEAAYFAMLDAGAAPQLARSALPTCLRTELVMTANFREWRHFLKLRLAPEAHPQIIEVARHLAAQLRERAPEAFEETMHNS